jgi:anti-anti-sigma factor
VEGKSYACANQTKEGHSVLELHGEMDIHTAPEFSAAALVALQRMHAEESVLVIDVSRLRFMDCAGVGALLATRRAAIAHARQVVVVGATGGVQKLLRLMTLESLFSLQMPSICLPREEEASLHLPV